MNKTALTADQVIEELALVAHPEGGWFRESFRSTLSVGDAVHASEHAASTAIYFLLRQGEFSAFHWLNSDEVWHHYSGDVLELHVMDAKGGLQAVRVGTGLAHGERPQAVVPREHWQAARVAAGPAGFVLCGCTVAPGFEFSDFVMPPRAELVERFPQHTALITSLTR
jgi:predicted cupin superfamily sugar epimerase